MNTIYKRKSALFITADPSSDKFDVSPENSIFRIGNKNDSKLDHIRPRDVDIFNEKGADFVRANKKGLSILTLKGVITYRLEGWIWIIFPNTPIPNDLILIEDNENHFSLAPKREMTLEKFKKALKLFKENFCIPWNIQSSGSITDKLHDMIKSNLNVFADKDPYFVRCLMNETILHFQRAGDFNLKREWNEVIIKNIEVLQNISIEI
ncbi:MAG: hypothetical protein H0V82_00290 [Candidatus Protochlamydia sp.]|nr:hypothetical protein [Candidatus Protochlamydia sp.]